MQQLAVVVVVVAAVASGASVVDVVCARASAVFYPVVQWPATRNGGRSRSLNAEI